LSSIFSCTLRQVKKQLWSILGLKLHFNLTFVGPCIVVYFYSKVSKMHNISNLFYFGTTLDMFQAILLASKQPQNLYDIYLVLYVQS
jgi:hypothetical protein